MSKLLAVGYTRVSSEGQKDGYSLEKQVLEIEQYCRENDIQLIAHFMEVESAATIKARPAFKDAVRMVLNRNEADYIVCSNLDRFSRNLLDFELLRRSFERKGKGILSTQQSFLTPVKRSQNYDYRLNAQKQMEMIGAEVERWKIRERCMSGKAQKEATGGWPGHRLYYEFDAVQGEPVLNSERLRVIRHIIRLRKLRKPSGSPLFSLEAISHYLNGNNNLLNRDGTRGRVFPPPSCLPSKRRRKSELIKGGKPTWGKTTIRKVFLCLDRRKELWIRYGGESA